MYTFFSYIEYSTSTYQLCSFFDLKEGSFAGQAFLKVRVYERFAQSIRLVVLRETFLMPCEKMRTLDQEMSDLYLVDMQMPRSYWAPNSSTVSLRQVLSRYDLSHF